ncbi:Pc21g07600 [Penicillium rubens Wisconsin 54-1255]|uniref:Pc21g07600 protein n=1 Tax=Penicillium rubens (strain ATCC 28089 / DSM 1075 / NRRL 1951 / Wisconsin 54-1255) TaxID=500485 RepID=B6HKU3_PENRW|nr:Pc21g07600 [Penicillium rubens Wisconsin 54-1255]
MSADQACVRCRRQKRKCDKILPCCTLCKRLNKHCDYFLPVEAPRLLPIPDWADLTPSNLRHTLEVQVSSNVGDRLQVQAAAAFYFRTVHTWFLIISEPSYNIRLSNIRVQTASAPSDLSLLTLCMTLVCKGPVGGELPLSTRSMYASLKSFVALLEAMGTNSLEMLQSRLLLTVFEIGHAMYPSAYISAAANMRAAVSLGINATSEDLTKAFQDSRKAEEARQTWRGITITNRSDLAPKYVSLENGQAPNTHSDQQIAAESEDWAKVEVDSFTRLAHASRLLDRVLVHIHTNQSNPLFDSVEAVQILKSLTSLLVTFQSGDSDPPHPLSDSALALCRSAMLETLEVGSHMNIPDNECCIRTSINILKSLVHELARGAEVSPPVEMMTLSVFLPHCIYKAAMVCLGDSRVSGCVDPEPSIRPLKDLLGYLGMRWVAAKRYLEKVDAT